MKLLVAATLLLPTAASAATEMDVVASVSQCYQDRTALTEKIAALEAQIKSLEEGPAEQTQPPSEPTDN